MSKTDLSREAFEAFKRLTPEEQREAAKQDKQESMFGGEQDDEQ